LAAGAAIPVVFVAAAPSGAAASCTASVSDARPPQNSTVTVAIVGPASATATVVAHYRGLDNSETVNLDANGHGSAGFNVGAAPPGETVVVNVTAGSTACSTSFTPVASSTTSTTTPSSTTSTTAAHSGTTTPTTPTTVHNTTATTAGTVSAAADAPAQALPFTGNATAIEAGAGALLVGAGVFVLGSARRREVLVKLLWPDER
jgi:hypothetical protein